MRIHAVVPSAAVHDRIARAEGVLAEAQRRGIPRQPASPFDVLGTPEPKIAEEQVRYADKAKAFRASAAWQQMRFLRPNEMRGGSAVITLSQMTR